MRSSIAFTHLRHTLWILPLFLASSALSASAPTVPSPVPAPPPGMPGTFDVKLPPDPDPEIKTVNGVKEVWIKTLDGQPFKAGTVELIPKGTKFYHWADPENSARWAAQGKVDPGEIKALDSGDGAIGGGFYVSTDFMDSSNFGPKLTVFTTTQDVNALTKMDPALIFSSDFLPHWNEFNKKLSKLGIDGVGRYDPDTWFNFFDANPLLGAKAAVWKDFEESDFAKNMASDMSKFLEVNSRIPLQETPWVKSQFPVVSQLLNHTLDVSKLDPKVKEQIVHWLIYTSTNQDQSPLSNSVRSLFISDVPATLKANYDKALHPSQPSGNDSEWARTGRVLELNIKMSRKLGIPYSSWLPDVVQPASIFPSIERADFTTANMPTLPYSTTINTNLKYLDIDDFLSAIAQGKPIDKIYDTPGMTPYLDRWQAANKLVYSNTRGEAAINILRALSGNPSSDFRDGPAGSDGDIVWQGKKYFRVNDQQGNALKKNPFITPEFQTIADPANPGKAIQVARYDYPTAADFEKYSEYLSDSTKQTLTAAKAAGTLNDVTTPEARALTKQMLSELANSFINLSSSLNGPDKKLLVLALHPFNEMNAEFATASSVIYPKASYRGNRTIPGKPDEELLASRETYQALAIEDSINSSMIQKAFARAEKDSPQFPRYFDVPEIWQVGRKISNIGPDPAAFVQQSKAIYAAQPIASCVMKTIDAGLNQGAKK